MSQPTLNSSLSGINTFNFVGMNRSGGGRLSYTSLRAASGDNSINEEERLSTPNVHALGGSVSPRGSLTMERSSSRLSQPDVRRFAMRHDKRERLSQPTLVTGDYYPGRTQQRLSQPCLSSGGIGMHSPSPPPYPLKHKRFGPAVLQASQRDRLSQLDIGAKYRNIKDLGGGGGGGGGNSAAQVKFNRDRFSIPELETQNDLRLIAGTPKQRFSLDSQLTKQRFSLDSQDSCKSRLLPIASSPIFEHQQMKTEELMGMTSDRLKSPTCEGLQSVIVATTSPIFPPGERRFLAPDFPFTGRKTSTSPSPPKSEVIPFAKSARSGKPPPIPMRERMSVPEIRNSSLRRLLDPPARQRHSIAGNLRQSLLSPVKLPEFGTGSRKSPRYSIDDALEKLKRIEKEENRRNQETSELRRQDTKEQDQEKEPKHIQRHYSYTYETSGSENSGSASTLGKLSVGGTPKRKFLESNFDENEQVITTVIETEIPMILPSTPGKYAKKVQAYSSDTPKWIRKYLENENSPKVGRKTSATGKDQIVRSSSRRSSRRKSSLESIEAMAKKPEEKARSKSASCEERNVAEQMGGAKETYVRIVPSNNAQQENRYEVGVETTSWTTTDGRGLYGDDTDTDDSTSI
ncbi:PREDICTED: serine/arginine repetitive matrix protein 1-like [Vollenhovia emeryi]|uniref:serine/arginine repetitive matrix protein 1-like n=1 Tax=Vollenhovia emeryi TaxID=411798 RepID=UPI0005F51BB7|nr:PREDICTED: serine/arginine repetitive matrix protein 1-like [Vollenhovia emeryi]